VSEATSNGVRVEVEPIYLPEQSDPKHGLWMFGYRVRITNVRSEAVQLLSRHWIITDANGHVEEVRGPGVVGQTPVIAPGQSYAYESGCPLPTAMGTMHGTYQMVTKDGARFDVTIAPFTLAEPYSVN
jgi:ApaG protein